MDLNLRIKLARWFIEILLNAKLNLLQLNYYIFLILVIQFWIASLSVLAFIDNTCSCVLYATILA